MVSVVIPSRNERHLGKTVNGIIDRFGGDYEIIVVLDGCHDTPIGGVRYIINEKSLGMRTSINQAVSIATGKYILKLDAHCMVDEQMDLKLVNEHHEKWVQVPRRKRLDAKTWSVIYNGKPDIDYMYISRKMTGIADNGKNRDLSLRNVLIDYTETFQGSCYFMEREYFKHLGLLDDVNFAGSGNEAQEITFKVLADGGNIIRNKKTWYAHARNGRRYSTDRTKSREYIRTLAKQWNLAS